MGDGGLPHHWLTRIRAQYPLSIHGVGLSLGGEAPPDVTHLDRIRALLERYQPAVFSEHLAWCSHGGIFTNDLLPLPYEDETLERVCEHIDRVQCWLGRRLLIENPSTYLTFSTSTMSEMQFLAELVRRSGCGLLLDVNNIHVSAFNQGVDPRRFLEACPFHAVEEIHLAGFAEDRDDHGNLLLIDTHGAAVHEQVWALYAHVLEQLPGPVATLIERDSHIPALSELLLEADRVDRALLDCRITRRALSS